MTDPAASHPFHGKSPDQLHNRPAGATAASFEKKPETSQATTTPPAKNAPTTQTSSGQKSFNTLLGSPINNLSNENYEDILLTDPKKYAQKVKEEAVQGVRQEQFQKQQADNFRKDFYNANPDLQGVEEQVESVLREKFQDWYDTPITEASKMLADETRRRIDRIKKHSGMKVETLKSENAATLEASGDSPAPVSAPAPKASSFVDELKEFRAKKRKKA